MDMYKDDVPIIRAYCELSPEHFADAITFALLSIRQPFGSVAGAMRDVRRQGRDSAYLWGWKKAGFDYAQSSAPSIWALVAPPQRLDTVTAMLAIEKTPGLGIVKSAFVAQMLGYEVACFDSRNAVTLELPERAFREFRPTATLKTRERRIAEYVRMTIDTGGAEHWWDHWCTGIAPRLRMTADEVSELHVRIVTGKSRRGRL